MEGDSDVAGNSWEKGGSSIKGCSVTGKDSGSLSILRIFFSQYL